MIPINAHEVHPAFTLVYFHNIWEVADFGGGELEALGGRLDAFAKSAEGDVAVHTLAKEDQAAACHFRLYICAEDIYIAPKDQAVMWHFSLYMYDIFMHNTGGPGGYVPFQVCAVYIYDVYIDSRMCMCVFVYCVLLLSIRVSLRLQVCCCTSVPHVVCGQGCAGAHARILCIQNKYYEYTYISRDLCHSKYGGILCSIHTYTK